MRTQPRVMPFPGPDQFPGGAFQPPIHPGYVAGRIYLGLYCGGTGTGGIVANVISFIPIILSYPHLWQGMVMEVTTPGTANNGRFGLYTAVNGQPGTLITGSGAAALIPGANPLQTIGIKTTSPIQQMSLPAGCYFGAFFADGTCTVAATGSTQAGYTSQVGLSTSLVTGPDGNLSATFPFGPLPVGQAFANGMGPPVYSSINNTTLVGLMA